jgi:hypothetical protein
MQHDINTGGRQQLCLGGKVSSRCCMFRDVTKSQADLLALLAFGKDVFERAEPTTA